MICRHYNFLSYFDITAITLLIIRRMSTLTMDIDSFVSELTDSEAEILEPRMKRETCDAITSTGYSIPQENKGYGMIYAIVKRHVDKIYETYCRSDGTHTFLTE